jgi:hypothetical protein
MKPARSANLLFGTAVTLCLVLCGCGKHEAEGSKAAEQGAGPTAEKTGEPESRVSHGTNAEAIITLDAETQKRIGWLMSVSAKAFAAASVRLTSRPRQNRSISAVKQLSTL